MILNFSSVDVGTLPPTLEPPRFCQSALGSQNLLFCGLRWLHSVQIQLPAGTATETASTDPVPLSGIKESLLARSATNAYQGCFDACVSMIKKMTDSRVKVLK